MEQTLVYMGKSYLLQVVLFLIRLLTYFSSTAIVHKTRKRLGKMNCTVFGIASSLLYFEFYRIDNDGRFSILYKRCKSPDYSDVVRIIANIVLEVAKLSLPSSEETDPLDPAMLLQ